MIWNALTIAVREIGRNLTRAFLTVLGIFLTQVFIRQWVKARNRRMFCGMYSLRMAPWEKKSGKRWRRICAGIPVRARLILKA